MTYIIKSRVLKINPVSEPTFMRKLTLTGVLCSIIYKQANPANSGPGL